MLQLADIYSSTDCFLVVRAAREFERALRYARDGHSQSTRDALERAIFSVEGISSLSTRERGLRLCTHVGSACALLIWIAVQAETSREVRS